MHDVSNAINILDSSKGVDKAICKSGAYNFSSGGAKDKELAEKCGVASDAGKPNNSTGGGLSLLWKESSSSAGAGNYHQDQAGKMGPITSGVISKDITALNREQKGVVSSAFAKAHEGARYTSMMYIYYQEEYA